MNKSKKRYTHTRKKIRERTPEPVSENKKINGSDYMWSSFLEEGDILYNYLVNNFEDLFDGNKIKHFGFRNGSYINLIDSDEMNIIYGKDIQNKLIPWIRIELEENRLFKKELWKPFRDKYDMSEMYHGYRKLFQYKQYYFQLAMESSCILDECEYCDLFDDEYNDKNSKHFKLALYGWKDDNSNVIRPCCTCCEIMIPSDNIMIERDWIYQ